MTNREWLESLSDEELVEWFLVGLQNLKSSYIQTTTGLKEWLSQEYVESEVKQ